MNNNNNDDVFNKLPASILSTIFAFAQNPQLSLLNKDMYKASQKVETIVEYILQYVLSNKKDSPESNLKSIFDKYTRISTNETVGMLVLSKIKNLNYGIALELAVKYKWRNILNKLLKMYVVIDRSTSTVVHKGNLFTEEGEYLDIEFRSLFSGKNEFRRNLTDIKISESLYIRPLVATLKELWLHLHYSDRDFDKENVKALIDLCCSNIELPQELYSTVMREAKFIDSVFMVFCILECTDKICKLGNLEQLVRVLYLKTNASISFRRLERIKNEFYIVRFWRLVNFIDEYGYTTKMDFLVYIACSYFSIYWEKEKLIKYLEDNYSNSTYKQILFDAAIHHKKGSLVKRYMLDVELNSENIRKITELAYRLDSIELIRLLVENNDKLKGDLDENALRITIKKKNYRLAQKTIKKHPNAVSIAILHDLVRLGNINLCKSGIEAGVDLKSPEFKGIVFASRNRDMNMLQLLLENGTSVNSSAQETIEGLCYDCNYEISERLLEFSDMWKNRIETKTVGSKTKAVKRPKFNKTILCLVWASLRYCDPYASRYVGFEDFFEQLNLYLDIMVEINSKRKDIIGFILSYLSVYSALIIPEDDIRARFYKVVEIIGYIIENNPQSVFNDTESDESNELEHKNDIEMLNDRHYEIVKLELVNRNFEFLKLLIECGMDVNSADSLILKTAYEAGDIDWINYFISKGAKFSGKSDGFEEACKSDKVDVLKYWIKNGGVVPKIPKRSCINRACLLSNFGMVKALVENGVDLSDPERNGVRVAFRLGLKRILKYLLDNNAAIKGVRQNQLEVRVLVGIFGR